MGSSPPPRGARHGKTNCAARAQFCLTVSRWSMRRFQVSGLILTSLFLASAGHAPAEETPRALIEKAIKAHGGQEKLARYKAVRTRTRGSMDVNGISVSFASRAAAQLPSQLRSELSVNVGGIKVTALEVLNGDKAW